MGTTPRCESEVWSFQIFWWVSGNNFADALVLITMKINFFRSLIVVLLLASSVATAKDNPNDITAEQKYRSGGSIRMQLSSGDYTISGVDSENIAVRYSANSAEQTRLVKVKIATKGSAAELSIHDTPESN